LSSPSPRFPRLGVLDGLRGFAVVQVVWYHVWQLSWLSPDVTIGGVTVPLGALPVTGYFGVELFFFLSGLCLYLPYLRERRVTGSAPGLRDFARRRAAKILPSYWLALAVASVWTVAQVDYATFAAQLASHLFFVHNWSPSTYGSMIGVLWSLAVEAQFYVLFPLVAAAMWRKPWLTWACCSAASLLYRVGVLAYGDTSMTFFANQLPGVLDLFLTGMLAAHVIVGTLPGAERGRQGTTAALIGGAGFLAIITFAYFRRYDAAGEIVWQMRLRLPLALCFACLTWGLLHAPARVQRLIDNAPLRFAGLISYNLYIWHQVVARWLYEVKWPAASTVDPHEDRVWQWSFTAAAALATLVVATALTYGVERPALRWAKPHHRK
jgi:peptidoglycan/LPS O-acetylase OafA/YrhL